MRKWSDSDSHKKARSFAGPLDAIVRERFFFHAHEVAAATGLELRHATATKELPEPRQRIALFFATASHYCA